MRAITREFLKRGIIRRADDMEICMKGAEYDVDENLISIDGNFIITVMYSAVLDPVFHIWDRKTLEIIGEQNVYPERMLCGNSRTWGSYGYIAE